MADLQGPLRPADSWSSTEVRSLTHNHVWTIKGFSQCECRYLETSTKIKDLSSAATASVSSSNSAASAAEPPLLTFRIRLHPQGNKESNKDFTFFQCFCNTPTTMFKAKYKFTVFNSRGEEINTTVYTGTQQLHGYFEYIRRDLLVNHVLPQDELQLNLELSVTFDTVTKTSQAPQSIGPPLPMTSEVSKDLEEMFTEGKLTDFIIVIGDREIHAHKVVLSARSPVFAAMLEPHTEEAQNNRVRIEDIEYDVMHELLMYMYSGRVPQHVSQMGLDLLCAAERFGLPGLKTMADHVLRSNLVVDTVCRNLVYADMYTSLELKKDAIKFINQNMPSVVTTEGYSELLKLRPDLITEILLSIHDDRKGGIIQSQPASGRELSDQPSNKRARLSHTPPPN